VNWRLDRIFDEALSTRPVLLFDEADTLSGKRSGVRDSHDRAANVDTNHRLPITEDTPA
jgi:hypothetical protein